MKRVISFVIGVLVAILAALLLMQVMPALFAEDTAVAGGAAQAKAQEPNKEKSSAEVALKIPPEEAKRENPIKAGEESIGAGKRLYATQCAMCHGAAGDGKGDLAVELKLKTKDWTAVETLKDRTDGELFYILRKGHGAMPGQEGRMKDDQMWHLVSFVRSVAKKPETK